MPKSDPDTIQWKIDSFAFQCFRDQADADYIAARMAFHAQLSGPAQWSSQQALEKYLKCILLLRRIPAKDIRHDICKAHSRVESDQGRKLGLPKSSIDFIEHIGAFGESRYLEISTWASGDHIVGLDRTVWELRKHCTRDLKAADVQLIQGKPAMPIRLINGYLEKVLSRKGHPARTALIRQNAFFSGKRRKSVETQPWIEVYNPPHALYPEIRDEIRKFVYLPGGK